VTQQGTERVRCGRADADWGVLSYYAGAHWCSLAIEQSGGDAALHQITLTISVDMLVKYSGYCACCTGEPLTVDVELSLASFNSISDVNMVGLVSFVHYLPPPRRIVIVVVCLSVCLFVCLFATLHKKLPNGFA